jgi:uncharacterized RDD family membrane protein YckC
MTSERGANPSTTTGGQDLAPLSGRFVALIIDWSASLLLAYLLDWTVGFELRVLGVDQTPALLFFVYYLFALTGGTQTLGMAAMRIACVRADTGDRLGFVRSLFRAFLLSLVVPAMTALLNRYHRGLHDYAGGSVMLRVPKP